MAAFIGLFGLLLFVIGMVSVVALFLFKRPKKKAGIIAIVGLAMFITGIMIDPVNQDVAQTEAVKENSEKVVPEKTKVVTEAKEKEENKPDEKKTDTTEKKQVPVIVPDNKKASEDKAEKPNQSTDTGGTTAKIPVELVKVIDGDTIKIIFEGKEQNVRYLLIDTPETNHPRLGKQPFGEEAKVRNKELIENGKLEIEFDVGERFDKYDRLLAYIYVDGKSVQKILLSEGLARVAYVYPPNTRHLDPYEKSQVVAKEKKIGIWSVENYATDSGFNEQKVVKEKPAAPVQKQTPPAAKPATPAPAPTPKPQPIAPTPPAEQECNIKGSNSGIYHTPSSSYYHKTTNVAQWFCSEEEARNAGYRAPKR